MQLGFEHSPANNLHLNYKAINFFGLMSGLLSFPSSSYDPVKFNASCIYGSYSVASGIQ